MRQALVLGNWKLHGSQAEVEQLLAGILAGSDALAGSVEVGVCPPYVFLPQAAARLQGSDIGLGAQNCATQATGAFTGEVSAAMLAEAACKYVIIGHSERRSIYAEGDADVVAKVGQVLQAGLVPVVCIGETLDQREAGQTLDVVGSQTEAVLAAYEASALSSLVLAYEPVWAIGTGLTASPEQAQEVHAALRAQLAGQDAALAKNTRILYGGSVKPGNAAELFAQADIDGGLIGGAALAADDFLAICTAGIKQ